MNLNTRTRSLTDVEAHKWLRSRHGFEAADGIILDGANLGAAFPTGLVPSGVILAKDTASNRWVLFDNATSANGHNVADGILKTSIDIRDGSGGFVNSPAAILRHCKVITAFLPRNATQTGGPHANAISGLAGRITFLS